MSEELNGENNTPNPGDVTPEQKDNTQGGSENERRLFARAKAAEEERNNLREEINKLKEESKKSQVNSNPVEPKADLDPFETVELVNTLKDFAPEELAFVKTFAKGTGKSLKEAAASEDVKLYVEARREKIKKDNITPDPSNKQSNPLLTAEEALSRGNFKDLSIEEKERLIKEADAKYRR